MTDKKELIATLAHYVLEYSFGDYPYITAANGDVVYTDAAQEMFNLHHDEIERIISE